MSGERLNDLWLVINEMIAREELDEANVINAFQGIIDNPTKRTVEILDGIDDEPKFKLFKDLGTIVIPLGAEPATRLAVFREKIRGKICRFDLDITDENFSSPSHVMWGGDKFHIRVFKQSVPGKTTSEERLSFLRKQEGNMFLGAQGASYVLEQKRKKLPDDHYYASFDEKVNLWYFGGNHKIPCIFCGSDNFGIDLHDFDADEDSTTCLLSFTKEEV